MLTDSSEIYIRSFTNPEDQIFPGGVLVVYGQTQVTSSTIAITATSSLTAGAVTLAGTAAAPGVLDDAGTETLGALTDLVAQGKIRYIGSSTYPAKEIVRAQWVAADRRLHRYVCEQPPYSLLARGIEADVLPACQDFGMAEQRVRVVHQAAFQTG